jgi:CheY-specific phosphatase CheX
MNSKDETAIPLCLQRAVVEVFQVQTGVAVQVESVASETGSGASDEVECMSVLGMKSSEYRGSLALGFPKASFLAFLEAMIGEKTTEINAENVDACGELLNIIYASARVKINEAGFSFEPSIPATVQGKDISVALGQSAKALKIRFRSEKGGFVVVLNLKEVAGP